MPEDIVEDVRRLRAERDAARAVLADLMRAAPLALDGVLTFRFPTREQAWRMLAAMRDAFRE